MTNKIRARIINAAALFFLIAAFIFPIGKIKAQTSSLKEIFIKKILSVQKTSPNKIGIYVPGEGILWFRKLVNNSYQILNKRYPVRFNGNITSPDNFYLKAEVSLYEAENISTNLSNVIIFKKAEVELKPAGIKLSAVASAGRRLVGLANLLSKNLGIRLYNKALNALVSDKGITLKISIPNKITVFNDRKLGTKVFAKNTLLEVTLNLKNKSVTKALIKTDASVQVSKWDTSEISLKSKIIINTQANDIILTASANSTLSSSLSSAGSILSNLNISYESRTSIFELKLGVKNLSLASLPFISPKHKAMLNNIIFTHANILYANKTGIILNEQIKRGLTIKGKARIASAETTMMLKYLPDDGLTYFSANISDLNFSALGMLPSNVSSVLPSLKIKNANITFSTKETVINAVKINEGLTVSGNGIIGSVSTSFKSYYNKSKNIFVFDYSARSAKLSDFINLSFLSSDINKLFDKMSLFNTSVTYSNTQTLWAGKTYYKGFFIKGSSAIDASRGYINFSYIPDTKTVALDASFGRLNLSSMSLFPSDTSNITSRLVFQNAKITYTNKTGVIGGVHRKEGLNLSGIALIGRSRSKFEIDYISSEKLFVLKSDITYASLADLTLPGIEQIIPSEIRNFLSSIRVYDAKITYANKSAHYGDINAVKGFLASGRLNLFGSAGRFKIVSNPDSKLYYFYAGLSAISPGRISILPVKVKNLVSKFYLKGAKFTYSNKNTIIDGEKVERGIKLSGKAYINRVQTSFELFSDKQDDFFRIKSYFPNISLYDLNTTFLPASLFSSTAVFFKNLSASSVHFEYANKSRMLSGENIKAGISAKGNIRIASSSGKFDYIYDKTKTFYYLNIDLKNIHLGSLTLLPSEINHITGKIYLRDLNLTYANKNGSANGNKVYRGYTLKGSGNAGNVKGRFDIEYDHVKKTSLITSNISKVSLNDINIFSSEAMLSGEINDFTRKCFVSNADLSYINKTGLFRGKFYLKGLKVKGKLSVFSDTADFEMAYMSGQKLYYLNTTINKVSLYDLNILRSASFLPSKIRNFGRNISISNADFTYSNKTGLVGNKLVYKGLAVRGNYTINSKRGNIDLRYSSDDSIFGFEMSLHRVSLEDVNIFKWFVTMPSDVDKLTKKIALSNISIKYGNKSGRAAGKKIKKLFSITASAKLGSKEADLTFINSPENQMFYLEMKINRITLDDLDFLKEFITIPSAAKSITKKIAIKNFTVGYANKNGHIGMKPFKKGFIAYGIPDLSGIPGFKIALKYLHLKDLNFNFDPNLGIYFDANLAFIGKLENLLAKFFKLRLPNFKIRIAFDGPNLSFNIPFNLRSFTVNLNPALGTKFLVKSMALKVDVPVSGGAPTFDFDIKMLIKPSKWDKWLSFEPELKFNPVTSSVGFAATMKDTWKDPFGIKFGNILIQNVALDIMINIETGLPTSIGFIGERLRFMNKNYAFMFQVAPAQERFMLGFKADKFTFVSIPVLKFLPSNFIADNFYVKNVNVKIAPNGGYIGTIYVKPGIVIKGSAKIGPFSGYVDLDTGGLSSFKGYFKGEINTGIESIKKHVLKKVKKEPYLKPLLSKVLNSFELKSIKWNFNASLTKAQMLLDVKIEVLGKNHSLKLDAKFDPLKLAEQIVSKILKLLDNELKAAWNALKKEIIKIGKDIKKDSEKAFKAVSGWEKNNIGPFVSSVSDYVKKVAYTAYKTVKQFFKVKKKDWYKPWKWHWKTITKLVKQAYKAFKYEYHKFSYNDRLKKMKSYVNHITRKSHIESIKNINSYIKNIKGKITDFEGDTLKSIVDSSLQPVLDHISSNWYNIYSNTDNMEHFFNSEATTSKGKAEYKKMVLASFQKLKTNIIQSFIKSFKNKNAMVKLVNEKSSKAWFAKFKMPESSK